MNTLVKSFIACVLVFGIVGCNDPKENTSKQFENNTEVNGTKIDCSSRFIRTASQSRFVQLELKNL